MKYKFRRPFYFYCRNWALAMDSYHRNKIPIYILIAIIIAVILIIEINKQLMPTIVALSETKAKNLATEIVTDVVNKKITNVKYNDLIYLQKDSNQKVTALQTNIVKMNKISSEITMAVQEKMMNLDKMYVLIPITNVFGNSFLSNRGPNIRVNITPVGNIDVDFKTEFVSAGINQTRHRIILSIKCKMLVILPVIKKGIDTETNIPVAETIIVGDVPDSFINVGGTGQ